VISATTKSKFSEISLPVLRSVLQFTLPFTLRHLIDSHSWQMGANGPAAGFGPGRRFHIALRGAFELHLGGHDLVPLDEGLRLVK
jgi:hypothetical protein